MVTVRFALRYELSDVGGAAALLIMFFPAMTSLVEFFNSTTSRPGALPSATIR